MVKTTTIENGIKVITESVENSRALAIGLLIDSSPRTEPSEKAGLAHLLEHTLFHGTSERSGLEISKMIDTMGGRVSAFTGRDYTCFSALVMDAHRTYVLDLFSDMLLNSIFPEDRLEYEKQVVQQEQEATNDVPSDEIGKILKENVWKDHPLGRPIDGYAKTVSNLTREDIIYYLHSTYLPGRITIAVAGNLDHDDIVAQVRDCFWRFSGSSENAKLQAPVFAPCNIVKQTTLKQSYFSIAVPAPEYAFEDRYSIHQLNTILGGGLSSRLFRSLREERGLVYDIQSDYHAYSDAGLIIVSGNTTPEYQQEAIDIVFEEVEGLFTGKKDVTKDEVWQAGMYTMGQHYIDSEDLFTKMSRLLTQSFYFGRVIPATEVIQNLERITAEKMKEVTESVFAELKGTFGIVVLEGAS